MGRVAPGWPWVPRASRGQRPVPFRASEDLGYDAPPLLALIHRSAWNSNSRKFGKNNVLNGTKFIGNSSALATVVALYNSVGLITSPSLKEARQRYAEERSKQGNVGGEGHGVLGGPRRHTGFGVGGGHGCPRGQRGRLQGWSIQL